MRILYRIWSKAHEIDKWYHIVGVYDGTELKIYTDHIEENNSQIGAVAAYTGPAPLRIGNILHSNHGNAGVFDGIIDEVRIYERSYAPDKLYVLKRP